MMTIAENGKPVLRRNVSADSLPQKPRRRTSLLCGSEVTGDGATSREDSGRGRNDHTPTSNKMWWDRFSDSTDQGFRNERMVPRPSRGDTLEHNMFSSVIQCVQNFDLPSVDDVFHNQKDGQNDDDDDSTVESAIDDDDDDEDDGDDDSVKLSSLVDMLSHIKINPRNSAKEYRKVTMNTWCPGDNPAEMPSLQSFTNVSTNIISSELQESYCSISSLESYFSFPSGPPVDEADDIDDDDDEEKDDDDDDEIEVEERKHDTSFRCSSRSDYHLLQQRKLSAWRCHDPRTRLVRSMSHEGGLQRTRSYDGQSGTRWGLSTSHSRDSLPSYNRRS